MPTLCLRASFSEPTLEFSARIRGSREGARRFSGKHDGSRTRTDSSVDCCPTVGRHALKRRSVLDPCSVVRRATLARLSRASRTSWKIRRGVAPRFVRFAGAGNSRSERPELHRRCRFCRPMPYYLATPASSCGQTPLLMCLPVLQLKQRTLTRTGVAPARTGLKGREPTVSRPRLVVTLPQGSFMGRGVFSRCQASCTRCQGRGYVVLNGPTGQVVEPCRGPLPTIRRRGKS